MFLSASILLSSCVWEIVEEEKNCSESANTHPYIYVINNSDEPICVERGRSSDTISPFEGIRYTPDCYEALPGETRRVTYGFPFDRAWEEWFDCDFDTVRIFIFDEALVQEGKEEESLLQRYDLSLQDLRDLHWRLVYPPSGRMKSIKMWPSYEEASEKGRLGEDQSSE